MLYIMYMIDMLPFQGYGFLHVILAQAVLLDRMKTLSMLLQFNVTRCRTFFKHIYILMFMLISICTS